MIQNLPSHLMGTHQITIKPNPIADSLSIWVILIVWEQKKVSQMLKCAVKDWEFGMGLGCDSPPGWPCLQSRAHFPEKLPAACQKSLSTPRSLKKNEKPWKTAQKSSDGILRFAPIHFPEKLPAYCQKFFSTLVFLKRLQIIIWSVVCHSGTISIQPRVDHSLGLSVR